MKKFKNRVFGCVIVKSINSNFNADFTGQPRRLPDGRIYATDKSLKYTVRHYIKNKYPESQVLYYRYFKEEGDDNYKPTSLDESYDLLKGANFENDHNSKGLILSNLFECIDVRLFGSTFAPKRKAKTRTIKTNISIHGPVQINHGLNQFYQDGSPQGEIYNEQITAPFRSDNEDKGEADQTTIGRQSKLREGHYAFHFSINPANLDPMVNLLNKSDKDKKNKKDDVVGLSTDDIDKLKESLRLGVTYLESSAKAGSDNECLLWIKLKDDCKKVLPSFTEMVKVTRDNDIVQIDVSKVSEILLSLKDDEIADKELYYLPVNTKVIGADGFKLFNLLNGDEIKNTK